MSYVKKLLAVGAFAVAAVAGTQSQAATYLLTASNTFGPGNYGSVEVSQDGADQLKYVVTLASGFGFVDTGAHVPFAFALKGAPTFSSTTLPTGFSLTRDPDSVDNAPFSASGKPGAYGFDYKLDCSDACTQASGGYGVLDANGHKTLTFDVKAPGLTESLVDFANTTAYGHVYFSADVISKGNTGTVGSLGPVSGVPEPATWAMMGLGVFAAGAVMRRRRQATARPIPA